MGNLKAMAPFSAEKYGYQSTGDNLQWEWWKGNIGNLCKLLHMFMIKDNDGLLLIDGLEPCGLLLLILKHMEREFKAKPNLPYG